MGRLFLILSIDHHIFHKAHARSENTPDADCSTAEPPAGESLCAKFRLSRKYCFHIESWWFYLATSVFEPCDVNPLQVLLL